MTLDLPRAVERLAALPIDELNPHSRAEFEAVFELLHRMAVILE